MSARYRLPDWLGGLAVTICGPTMDGSEIVAIAEGEQLGKRIRVTKSWLVEVKPPSIDDPVSLPLTIQDAFANKLVIEAGTDGFAAWVCVEGSGVRSRLVGLAEYGLRQLARAAWQRANALEDAS